MASKDAPPVVAEQLPGVPASESRVVHVIEDDEPVRVAIAMLLRSASVTVVTHASGRAFLEWLDSQSDEGVGCVLTDIRMPGFSGLELLRRLNERGLRAPVIVMTAHGDITTAVTAMKAGAVDFIEKPFDESSILTAIASALETTLVEGRDTAAAKLATLSPREKEVLQLLAAGKPNKLIARELDLSPRTVELHRARLMARLNVGSLAEAVRIAILAEIHSSK